MNKRVMAMKSLDIYIPRPEEMTAYLARHGWHFSKKAFGMAASKMRKGKGEKIEPMSYDEIDNILKKYAIDVKNDNGYDKAYVASMCRADYFGSSVEDEKHLAFFVRDFLDDPDGSDEKAFRHWYVDMVSMGVDIPWDEIL